MRFGWSVHSPGSLTISRAWILRNCTDLSKFLLPSVSYQIRSVVITYVGRLTFVQSDISKIMIN